MYRMYVFSKRYSVKCSTFNFWLILLWLWTWCNVLFGIMIMVCQKRYSWFRIWKLKYKIDCKYSKNRFKKCRKVVNSLKNVNDMNLTFSLIAVVVVLCLSSLFFVNCYFLLIRQIIVLYFLLCFFLLTDYIIWVSNCWGCTVIVVFCNDWLYPLRWMKVDGFIIVNHTTAFIFYRNWCYDDDD